MLIWTTVLIATISEAAQVRIVITTVSRVELHDKWSFQSKISQYTKKTEFVHTLSQLHGCSAITDVVSAQNDSGDLRGVAGGDGELGCLCGKAGTSHLCDGSANSSDFTLYITAAQVATVIFMTHEYTTWLIVMVY